MYSIVFILSTLAATPNDPRPTAAGDVLVCDFDEAVDRDYDGWPDGWTRRRSRDLPEFLPVSIVPEQASGSPPDAGRPNHCLLVELDGGGAVVFSPAYPVNPQFSLLLTIRVKTAGLKHDGAWVELALLDQQGKVLQRERSDPVTECPDWQEVRIGPLEAATSSATHAQVSLHLTPLGKREDLTGRAWFDDLKIVRLPRMQLIASSSPGLYPGLYTKRDGAELVCTVSGIRIRAPRIRFELFNHQSDLLAELVTPLVPRTDAARLPSPELADGYAGQAKWSPPLPDYGFYRVRAALLADEAEPALLDRTQSLVVLRPFPQAVRSAFGWSLPGAEEAHPERPLASLLGQAGLGWAKMQVWSDPRESAQADRIAGFAEQLSIQGIEMVGVLDQPPPELRQVFREPGRLPVASVFAEPELWQREVGPIMTRLSLKVHWWQLGDDQDLSFIGYPHLETKLAEIKRHLEQYGQQIHLGINWRWMHSPPVAAAPRSPPWAFLTYGEELPLTAEEIGDYLQLPAQETRNVPQASTSALSRGSLTAGARAAPTASRRTTNHQRRSDERPQRWLLLTPLARGEYASHTRVHDLVLRMLAAKLHGADAVFVPTPFDDDTGVMNADGSPGELFIPWRTTAMLVGGAEYLGPLQLAGGSTGHVFAKSGRAVMAVWADRPTTERVFLGDKIEQVDVWGRATQPKRIEQDGRLLHELTIDTQPTFISGLSESVVRWQAALAFENPQLSSVAGREQIVTLRLKNTFPQAVNGELTLFAPKSWAIDSRPVRFKIAEGEELRLPLPVTLLGDANSGPQPVRLDFDVAGNRFSVHRTLQLGLDDVQVEMTSRLRKDESRPGAPRWDLVVELHLTNLSPQPLSFQCVLFAPQRRRETRQAINLTSERTTLTVVLRDGEQLVGQKLWLRAEEIGGPRVLNYQRDAER